VIDLRSIAGRERLVDRLWMLRAVDPAVSLWNIVAKRRDVPLGASSEPMRGSSAPPLTGRVAAARLARSPLTDTPCAAFAVQFRHRRADGSPVTLRDGATIGFDIVADDGVTVRVAPGRVDLTAAGRRLDRFHPNIRRYLASIDPDGRPSTPWQRILAAAFTGRSQVGDAFPYTAVLQAVLRPGDRVRLHNPLTIAVDARGAAGDYRTPAPSHAAPQGTPVLELVER
jgi:hypothetical protein